MKTLFTCLFALFISTSAFSQGASNEVEMYQSIFGMEKKIMVGDFLALDDAQAKVFWPVYDEYELKRKAFGQDRIDIIMDYAENYDSLSDDKMHELVLKTAKLQGQMDKLVLEYYNKINKSNTTKIAAQFFQIERYFSNVIRYTISSSIPFVGELEINTK